MSDQVRVWAEVARANEEAIVRREAARLDAAIDRLPRLLRWLMRLRHGR